MQIEIDAGLLDLRLHRGASRLHELLGFASRQNPKRGYLFVSKVLGKHIPVRPARMRALYAELAADCAAASGRASAAETEATLVVGMAETATGLGAGVADELARCGIADSVLYMHTTRHQLGVTPWLRFDESHSHAVDHLLYPPDAMFAELVSRVRRLVLVDDEVSTGRTLGLLASRALARLPQLDELVLVSIVDWLTPEHQRRLESLPVPVRFVALMQGRFDFRPRPDFTPDLPPKLEAGLHPGPSREDLGRRGILVPHPPVTGQDLQAAFGRLPEPAACPPLAVIGWGEHLYEPFLLAEALEQQGYDVVFQSTTRSPILLGGAIRRKLVVPLDGGRVHHYCYNLDPARRPLLCQEAIAWNAAAAEPLTHVFENHRHAA